MLMALKQEGTSPMTHLADVMNVKPSAINEVRDWESYMVVYKFPLDEMNTKLRILNEEFQLIHDHNPIEHLKTRIKEPQSIMEKLKGYEPTIEHAREHIQDIAGIRVTCSFVSDIYEIYEMIRKQDDIHVVKVKDYIQTPKSNGYQSLHLIIGISVFLTDRTERVAVEVQIRTSAMDFWASLEHKIYYKFQKDVPEYLLAELKMAADMAHYLDHKMKAIKEEMEMYKV
jgi:putative GTP pyrophosphokinase